MEIGARLITHIFYPTFQIFVQIFLKFQPTSSTVRIFMLQVWHTTASAVDMASSEAPPPSGLQDWEYVKQGIALWLNNQPKAAEESFKNRESSVHIVAGHTFISFMVSWMEFFKLQNRLILNLIGFYCLS